MTGDFGQGSSRSADPLRQTRSGSNCPMSMPKQWRLTAEVDQRRLAVDSILVPDIRFFEWIRGRRPRRTLPRGGKRPYDSMKAAVRKSVWKVNRKRAHDGFDLDSPGKDSWRLREAGCREVVIVGDRRWALLHENSDEPEPTPAVLAHHITGADIVLFEGFRNAPLPMIEVFRPSLGRPMLWPGHPSVVALATDGDVSCPLPVLSLAAPQSVADFIVHHLGIRPR